MPITIKDVHGQTLYVAKHAQDVRTAVQDAVAKKADLGSANLRYADLRYANLGSADLTSADLGYANLRSANLTSANLTSANLGYANLGYANLGYADLGYADLGYANLGYADLGYANLRYANLRSADLRYANLRYANLGSADLTSADLGYANLGYAKGIDARHHNPLLLLLDQPGKVRAYKLVDREYMSPIQTNQRIKYEVGATLECPDANTDPLVECAAGINVATLPWCVRNWRDGNRIMLVEFTAKDVAAVPLSDGKFRLRRCRVLRGLDLAVEVGLPVGVVA